jgi:hypothetical protein
MARQSIREFLAEEAADVEAHLDEPNRPMFRSKRPSVDPSQVYPVRVPVGKLEQLRLLALEAGITQSELIRRWTLERLDVQAQRNQKVADK